MPKKLKSVKPNCRLHPAMGSGCLSLEARHLHAAFCLTE